MKKAIYTKENESLLTRNGHIWNFHDAKTREHLHALHPYPAKFIPQIPSKAIKSYTVKGDLVYDPFAGCGTTLLEASLLGRPSIGTDNNPVAILVAKAKTAKYKDSDIDALRAFQSRVKRSLSSAKPRRDLIPDNKNFLYWFSGEVLDRLSSLKELILTTHDPIRTLLLALFSAIIVRVSYQDSDTRYAKIQKMVEPEQVDKLFTARLDEIIDRLSEVIVSGRAPAIVYQADAREVSFIKSRSVSLIVTSPPYLNAYDYHKYHRQRIHWIGGDVEYARDKEIGSHDEFTRPKSNPDQYFIDMNKCFAEWARILKPGRHCVIVIGDAIVNKKPVAVADTFIDLMKQHKLVVKKRWIRKLHTTKRAFNVANSRISHEHVLLLVKRNTL